MDEESKIRDFWIGRSKLTNFLWEDRSELNANLTNKYLKPNSKILDLGCGNGSSLKGLAHEASEVILVDYVQPQHLQIPYHGTFIKDDLRLFNIDKQFDLILLYGVANSFNESDIYQLYKKCYNWLKVDGTLIVKHQCGKHDDVFVDRYSEELQTDYCAYYYSVEKHNNLLMRSGFNVEVLDPYPIDQNKWENTIFKAFACSKTAISPYTSWFSKEYQNHILAEWDLMHERRKVLSRSKEIKLEILTILKEYLDKNQIPFYLMYGTLLGAYRDGNFIEWDTDVDVGILGRFQNRLAGVVDNFGPLRLLRVGDYYCSLMYKDEFVDIYTYTEDGEKYSYCGGLKEYFDEEKPVFDIPSDIEFQGMNFLTVREPKESLARWYGSDWETPKKSEWIL